MYSMWWKKFVFSLPFSISFRSEGGPIIIINGVVIVVKSHVPRNSIHSKPIKMWREWRHEEALFSFTCFYNTNHLNEFHGPYEGKPHKMDHFNGEELFCLFNEGENRWIEGEGRDDEEKERSNENSHLKSKFEESKLISVYGENG